MLAYVVVATALVYAAEAGGNPLHIAAGLDRAMGNMEGKEVRFGMALMALFTATTTGASCGAVNAMFDSFTPLGGLVPLFLIQLGEVLPGGVGSGLYGMLVFALLAVFIAGLMVGRTPEYLGKKVQAREVRFPWRCRRPSRPSRMPGRTGFRRCSTPIARRRGTTARPLAGLRPTRPG